MELMQASEYVSEFILTRVHGKTFVMVEGTTDRALWAEYTADDCELRPAHGKDIILEVLTTPYLRGLDGIAGIVDADYWLITKADELGTDNLLYDDCYPDLEMMILSSATLLEVSKQMVDYDDDLQINVFPENLQNEAERLAMEFGYFRLLNDCRDCGIDFKGFEYRYQPGFINFEETDFIDIDAMELRHEWTARRLAERSKGLVSWEDLIKETSELRVKHPPKNRQLCRGKDVISIAAYILPKLFSEVFGKALPPDAKRAFQAKVLSKNLRSAYDLHSFKQTSLFGCIRTWEKFNSPYKILKPEI